MMDDDTTDARTADASTADAAVSEANWAPTRASTAVAVAGTAAGIALLTRAAGVGTGAFVGAAGAVLLALSLWLLTFEKWRVPATLAASLLLVPAGGAVAAGVGYELLVQFAISFPAANETGVVGQMLRIASVAAVLWGCTLAAFGAAASVRNVAGAETLARCYGLVVRTALLPVGFGVALAGHALVTQFDVVPVDRVTDRAVSTASEWLFAPGATEPKLASFWLLFAVAAFATSRALRALPIRELAGDATAGEIEVAAMVDAAERGSVWLAFGAFATLPVAILVGVLVPTAALRAALPPGAYGLLVDATTSTGLRHAFVRLAVITAAVAGAARLVRTSIRTPTADLLVGYAPFLAGLAVVAGAGVAHRPVLDGLLGFVAGRLDAPLDAEFRRLSGSVVEFYGPETIVVGLVALVAVFATAGVFALWLAFALGFVSDRVGGASLAGGGLFLAAAFAGTLDAPLRSVLTGLALALVVWDAGEFAATLGTEVGRKAETLRAELLHAVGSLSVGAIAVAAAVGLAGAVSVGANSASAISGGAVDATAVALLGAVGGVVLLVMALR